MALVLLPGGSDVAGKAVKVILPLAGKVLFQSQKVCVRKEYIFISAISGGGLPLTRSFVWLSIRLFILVWLGDGFPTVIRSGFRLSVGRFSVPMKVGFPSVSGSGNCTTGISGTFTYRRLAQEKPARLRSNSPAASSSFSAPFMVVQPLSSISAISAMG